VGQTFDPGPSPDGMDPERRRQWEEWSRAQLEALGWEPLRDFALAAGLEGGDRAPFDDLELEDDLQAIRQAGFASISEIRAIDRGSDILGLYVSPRDRDVTPSASSIGRAQEVLSGVSRALDQAATRLASARTAAPVPSDEERADLAYIEDQIEVRTARAIALEEFSSNGRAPAAEPLFTDAAGSALSRFTAGTLAQKYHFDAFYLRSIRSTYSAFSEIAAFEAALHNLSIAFQAHANGFLESLVQNLARRRKAALRVRHLAAATLSLLLVFGSVMADRYLSGVERLDGALWVSLTAGLLFWLFDWAASRLSDRAMRQKQLELLADAVDQATSVMLALRRQQHQLNQMRSAVGLDAVALVDDWRAGTLEGASTT